MNNYFERDMLHVGEPNEDCRHYEAFDLINPDRYSSTLPDLTDITKIAFSFVVTEAVSADGIRLDNITATLGGFTLKKTIR